MVNLEEEWEVLTQVTKHPESCQGYIPTLWEISRWISANEGTYISTCMNHRSYIYSGLLHIVCFWAGSKMSANQSNTKTDIFWRKSALHCRFDSYCMNYEYISAYRVKKVLFCFQKPEP